MKTNTLTMIENALANLKGEQKSIGEQISELEQFLSHAKIGSLDVSTDFSTQDLEEMRLEEEDVREEREFGEDSSIDEEDDKKEIGSQTLLAFAKEYKIFSLRDVMRYFHVSMNTARKYVSNLRQDGIISFAQERERGKGIRYKLNENMSAMHH